MTGILRTLESIGGNMSIIYGRIFKPERILYYIQPTQDEINAFYKGEISEKLLKYDGMFGTYDCPGLFILNSGENEKVILGIEFRPDDDRVSYPDDLESMILPSGFMISTMFPDDLEIDRKVISEYTEEVQKHIGSMAFQKDIIRPKSIPAVIQVFTLNEHNRILIDAECLTDDFFGMVTPESEKEKVLFQNVYHDPITGHYNWNYIWPIIAGYGLKGIQDFAFVHFDVKDFKAVNVVYGHDAANNLLIRIVEHMNETDWIYCSARCDNDNFAMMIKDMPEEEMREKLVQFFDDISHLDVDENYRIYYRCGVVPMKNTLLLGDRVADSGKQVQKSGNNMYETEVLFYTNSMNEELDWSIKTRSYLDTAIKQDEFLVYLQPKYDIATETLCGAEALIRWKYHGRNLISPARFIPIFETGGLISKLDDIVLKKVCSYMKKWKEQGLPLYPISVNLSRKSLGDIGLTDRLTGIVDEYGVDHSLIDFELTESAVHDNQKYLISVMNDLKGRGFKISMDDFGTGYSSLSLLNILPFDTIKIDKSFVDGIGYSEDKAKENAIMKHVIAMTKDLELKCLAEGVEDKEQVELLKEFGCEVIQGYYYSRPLPVEEYELKLK